MATKVIEIKELVCDFCGNTVDKFYKGGHETLQLGVAELRYDIWYGGKFVAKDL